VDQDTGLNVTIPQMTPNPQPDIDKIEG